MNYQYKSIQCMFFLYTDGLNVLEAFEQYVDCGHIEGKESEVTTSLCIWCWLMNNFHMNETTQC